LIFNGLNYFITKYCITVLQWLIWRKSDEEIDEENTSKKWRLWRRIAQTVIVVLSFLVLLAVWPSGGLGIGFVAVATVLIIKTWTDR
jgi:amino acid transporter